MTPTPTTPPATHSPLPWHCNAIANGRIVGDASVKAEKYQINGANCTIATVYRPNDAALIVSACNGHAKLVEALRSFPSLPFIEDMTTDKMADKLREISAWLDTDARSALASVGEKT